MSHKGNDEWLEGMRELNPKASSKSIRREMGDVRKPHVIKSKVASKMSSIAAKGESLIKGMQKQADMHRERNSMKNLPSINKANKEFKNKMREYQNRGGLNK